MSCILISVLTRKGVVMLCPQVKPPTVVSYFLLHVTCVAWTGHSSVPRDLPAEARLMDSRCLKYCQCRGREQSMWKNLRLEMKRVISAQSPLIQASHVIQTDSTRQRTTILPPREAANICEQLCLLPREQKRRRGKAHFALDSLN